MVIERVGQPVTKVVNPLGTVITVSADEDDVSSSQEFECAVEEPPRSVCAEEGPASLSELEPESQSLRNLTKICAEMRSASEPAIDRVPDDNIKDVTTESKTLCVEAARMLEARIDFESEESFREVPTSLSLCAEQGEIPSSPMTQARESQWGKRVAHKSTSNSSNSSTEHANNNAELRERNFSKAKYVVSYDEDSVVLMENKCTEAERQQQQVAANEEQQRQQPSRKASEEKKQQSSKERRRGAKRGDNRARYIVKEHEDSIVVEDTTPQDEGRMEAIDSEPIMIEATTAEAVEPFVELGPIEAAMEDNTTARDAAVPFTMPDGELAFPLLEHPVEGFSSIEYHITDASRCLSTISDEDIEHIQRMEASPAAMIEGGSGERSDEAMDNYELQLPERKTSKSTISDDDLEHIQSSEIIEALSKASKLIEASNKFAEIVCEDVGNLTRNVLSSDDDLEHVTHKEVSESTPQLPAVSPPEAKQSECRSASRGSRKRKDVIVNRETPDTEVRPIASPKGYKSQTPDKDLLSEELDKCAESQEQSLPKKTKVKSTRSSNTSKQAPQQPRDIEIIDIDAMQKAEEMIAVTPECKILEPRTDSATPHSRKSRRNKKHQREAIAACQEVPLASEAPVICAKRKEDDHPPAPPISWSSIVRTNASEAEPVLQEVQEMARVSEQDLASADQQLPEGAHMSVAMEEEKTKEATTAVIENSDCTRRARNTSGRGKKARMRLNEGSSDKPCESEPKAAVIGLEVDAPLAVSIISEETTTSSGVNAPIEADKLCEAKPEGIPAVIYGDDGPNASVIPMDTEEDSGVVREPEKSAIVVSNTVTTTPTPPITTTNASAVKKSKLKKKKRR